MAEIILTGDALEQLRHLPPESVHTCVTSPPYYNLRDYGAAGQIGNEDSVDNPKVIRERGANHLVIAVYRDHWHVARVGGYTPDTGLYTKLY